MAQFGWTVITRQGQRYKIGLYHGTRTGHLLIHCNGKILQVDFNVRQSKTYSFFLDEQLYEVKLDRQGDQFGYTCEENEDVDTPLNKERKIISAKTWKKTALLVLGFAVLVLSFSYFMQRRHVLTTGQDRTFFLSNQQPTGKSKLKIFDKNGHWYYSFLIDGRVMQGRLDNSLSTHPFGFPMQSGDEFVVKYSIEHPAIFEILWEEEIPGQVIKYSQLAGEVHLKEHPELAQRQVRCQLQLAKKLRGLKGLAILYHQQNVASQESPDFNNNTYLRLVRSEDFKQGLQDCL